MTDVQRDRAGDPGVRLGGGAADVRVPGVSGMSGVSPYRVLHWATLGACIALFVWLVILLASWSSVAAAILGVVGGVLLLWWINEQETTQKVGPIARYDQTVGADVAAVQGGGSAAMQGGASAADRSSDADWEVGP